MILRGITEEMVKNSLAKPDSVCVGYDDKSLVFKKFNRGTIKIVFISKKVHYVIVSVIWEIIKR